MWHLTLNIKLPDYSIPDRNNQREFIYYIEEQIRTILNQRFRNVDISYHTDYHPDPVAARPETEFERMYLNKWEFEDEEVIRNTKELRKLLEEEDLLPKDFIQEKEMKL